MSAFIVSDRTMQLAVAALRVPTQSCEDADNLGRELYALNLQAVNHRYGGRHTPGEEINPEWQWKGTYPLVGYANIPEDLATACEWVKALHCLRYQMSEGDAVPATAHYAEITARIRQIEAHIVTRLPEYDSAPWDN